jgi:hypothetical protein
MLKKYFIIVQAILILNSALRSLYTAYWGPSRFDSKEISAIWVKLYALLFVIYLAKKIKAKYCGISLIALFLAGVLQELVAIFPANIYPLIGLTLFLDIVSAITLSIGSQRDEFDFSLWKEKKTSFSPYFLIFMACLMVLGIFLFYIRG